MIHRFLCLLLVPLMLTTQGLYFAHSHHAAEPEGHALRPHFHFGGHGHNESTHDHDHHANHEHHADHSGHDPRRGEHDATLSPAIAPIGDHDADAVYFGETVTTARRYGNSVIVLLTKYIAVAAILRVVYQSEGSLQRLGQPPSVFDAACPIYLRTLSLRI